MTAGAHAGHIAEPAPDVTVTFAPLLRREDGREWIVGRAPAGPFVALPGVGVEAIDLLDAGATVGHAAAELERRHGEPVDVAAFVAGLSRVGLVAAVAGRAVVSTNAEVTRGATLPWLRDSHLRWLPTRATFGAWAVVVTLAVAVLVVRPDTRPRFSDLVWADSAALVTVVNAVLLSVVIFLHECAHLALARVWGVPATISVSTRLTFLVAQTDITGAWVLPRRRRIALYVVGMAFEVWLASLAVISLSVVAPPSGLATFLRAFALTLALGVVIQFTFYLRTDVFFLIQDLTRCRDLYGDSRRLLAHWFSRRPDPRVGRARHERIAVTVYAPLLAVGVLITLGLFVFVTVPVAVRLTLIAIDDLGAGWPEAADGAASLAVLCGLYGALLVLSARKILCHSSEVEAGPPGNALESRRWPSGTGCWVRSRSPSAGARWRSGRGGSGR